MGYTNLFCIPEVTSVLLSCCVSVLGDSLQFHQGNRVSLRFDWEHGTPQHEMQGNWAGLIMRQGGRLMSFLELRQARGVYSRVTAGMAI